MSAGGAASASDAAFAPPPGFRVVPLPANCPTPLECIAAPGIGASSRTIYASSGRTLIRIERAVLDLPDGVAPKASWVSSVALDVPARIVTTRASEVPAEPRITFLDMHPRSPFLFAQVLSAIAVIGRGDMQRAAETAAPVCQAIAWLDLPAAATRTVTTAMETSEYRSATPLWCVAAEGTHPTLLLVAADRKSIVAVQLAPSGKILKTWPVDVANDGGHTILGLTTAPGGSILLHMLRPGRTHAAGAAPAHRGPGGRQLSDASASSLASGSGGTGESSPEYEYIRVMELREEEDHHSHDALRAAAAAAAGGGGGAAVAGGGGSAAAAAAAAKAPPPRVLLDVSTDTRVHLSTGMYSDHETNLAWVRALTPNACVAATSNAHNRFAFNVRWAYPAGHFASDAVFVGDGCGTGDKVVKPIYPPLLPLSYHAFMRRRTERYSLLDASGPAAVAGAAEPPGEDGEHRVTVLVLASVNEFTAAATGAAAAGGGGARSGAIGAGMETPLSDPTGVVLGATSGAAATPAADEGGDDSGRRHGGAAPGAAASASGGLKVVLLAAAPKAGRWHYMSPPEPVDPVEVDAAARALLAGVGPAGGGGRTVSGMTASPAAAALSVTSPGRGVATGMSASGLDVSPFGKR